jgi:hypothetical protein
MHFILEGTLIDLATCIFRFALRCRVRSYDENDRRVSPSSLAHRTVVLCVWLLLGILCSESDCWLG